jgi:glycosyltransferase involved in cell wall biosynthesis
LLGFRPGAGGIPRVMLDLIDGLHARGRSVDVLLPPGDYPDLARLASAAPRIFPLPGADSHAALAGYLQARRPVALLSNKDRASALLAERRAQGAWLPPVWLRIGSDMREKVRGKALWQRPAYRKFLRQSYLAADGLIANSAGVADSLSSLLAQVDPALRPPVRVIANPLNLERIFALASAPAPHPWLEDHEVPVILGLGRLVAVKDFPTLIRAFARLRQAHPARLIIFGEGRQRAALERLIRRLGLDAVVALPGYIDNPFAALARAALFVLCSRYEGSPNVLIEALACATPCVATDCRSGPREILAHGQLGALTPVGEPEALAHAMLATLKAPPPAERLRSAAQRFDLGSSIAAYGEALGLFPADDSP